MFLTICPPINKVKDVKKENKTNQVDARTKILESFIFRFSFRRRGISFYCNFALVVFIEKLLLYLYIYVTYILSSWWYTLPDASHIYQKVTEGIVQELTSTEDCSNTAMSTLTLTMSAELDGAVFVCSPTLDVGEDGKPQNADEVKIILYGKHSSRQPSIYLMLKY
jgi:hypothetical protein